MRGLDGGHRTGGARGAWRSAGVAGCLSGCAPAGSGHSLAAAGVQWLKSAATEGGRGASAVGRVAAPRRLRTSRRLAVVEEGAQRPARNPAPPSDHLCSLAEPRLIPHLIRTSVRLEWGHDQHGTSPDSTPRPRSSSTPGTAAGPRTPPRRTCSAPRSPGRTCTRRSRSVMRSGSVTPRSRSPARVRRWWRSSVWPSSRPRSGCPPRPARPTSVRPWSCGTGSRAPGPGSGPGTCRRGGPAGSPAKRSPSRSRRRGSWTTRSRGSRTGSAPAAWTGWSRRRSCGSCPMRPARRREAAADGRHAHVHTHQVSFEGTVWVEAEVDLADALDLDTALSAGAARLADLGSAASLDVRRSEALGAMARHQLAAGPRHRAPRPAPRPARRAREVVLHVHLSEDAMAITAPDDRLHLARVANTRSLRRRRPGPRLVPRSGCAGDGEAGARPGRAPARGPVPGPRPDGRPGSRAGPDLRVPVVHPPRREVRHRPRDPLRRGRPDGE